MEDIQLDRVRHFQLILDPVKTGGQHNAEGQIRIAGRIRETDLYARGVLLSGLVHRHPHKRRAVAPSPDDINGRLITGHQPLIGICPLICDKAYLTRVLHDPGDIMPRVRGKIELVALIKKGVLALEEQRLMHMHPRTVLAENGLGHERGVEPVVPRHRFDGDLVGDDIVRHPQRLRVTQVYLVLRRRHLVVRILNDNAHILQRHYRLPPQIVRRVQRQIIKITALIRYLGLAVALKIKIFQLRTHIEKVIAHGIHLGEISFQYVSRVTGVRLVVGTVEVAEHPRDGILLRPPRQDLKSRGIGLGYEIALVDPRETLNGRTVKTHTVGESFRQLVGCYGERFHRPQNIHKPDLDESDILLFHYFQNIFCCSFLFHYFLLKPVSGL